MGCLGGLVVTMMVMLVGGLILEFWYLLPLVPILLVVYVKVLLPANDRYMARRSQRQGEATAMGLRRPAPTVIEDIATYTALYTLPLAVIGFLPAQRSIGIYRLMPGGFATGEVFRMVVPPILGFGLAWGVRRALQRWRPPGSILAPFGRCIIVAASIAPLVAISNGRLWGNPADPPATTADAVIVWFWRWSAILIAALVAVFVVERMVRRPWAPPAAAVAPPQMRPQRSNTATRSFPSADRLLSQTDRLEAERLQTIRDRRAADSEDRARRRDADRARRHEIVRQHGAVLARTLRLAGETPKLFDQQTYWPVRRERAAGVIVFVDDEGNFYRLREGALVPFDLNDRYQFDEHLLGAVHDVSARWEIDVSALPPIMTARPTDSA